MHNSLTIKTNNIFSYSLYRKANEIPNNWDDISNNIFLSISYLKSQEKSVPKNMSYFYLAVYKNNEIIGKSVLQLINLNKNNLFKFRDNTLKNNILKRMKLNLLCVGNIMLTGEHSYELKSTAHEENFIFLLSLAISEVRKICKTENNKVHLLLIKDFYSSKLKQLRKNFPNYKSFSVQPNMILEISKSWNSFDDYKESLKTKYRTRCKRVFVKSSSITFKELNEKEIKKSENKIYHLYLNVLKNTKVSPYILPHNFFYEKKRQLKDNYIFIAGYHENEIICFYSLLKNKTQLQSGFLGYDLNFFREKQLYNRMLFEMTEFAILNEFKSLSLSRTALEIKSTIGAKPHDAFGLIKHSNPFINFFLIKILNLIYKPEKWVARSPFK